MAPYLRVAIGWTCALGFTLCVLGHQPHLAMGWVWVGLLGLTVARPERRVAQ